MVNFAPTKWRDEQKRIFPDILTRQLSGSATPENVGGTCVLDISARILLAVETKLRSDFWPKNAHTTHRHSGRRTTEIASLRSPP